MRPAHLYRILCALLITPLCAMACRSPAPSSMPNPSLIPDPPLVTSSLETSDRDNDGVMDAVDQCPSTPEDRDGLADEDGCPEDDADNDGFPDTEDVCPGVGETLNGFEDNDGCPDEGRALCNDCQAIRRLVLVVYFDEGDDEIKPDEVSPITQLATEILASDPPLELFVVGHTSMWGDAERRKDLGRQRALTVKNELMMLGVEEESISISSRGARSPRVPHDARGAQYLNDRVEVHVR